MKVNSEQNAKIISKIPWLCTRVRILIFCIVIDTKDPSKAKIQKERRNIKLTTTAFSRPQQTSAANPLRGYEHHD